MIFKLIRFLCEKVRAFSASLTRAPGGVYSPAPPVYHKNDQKTQYPKNHGNALPHELRAKAVNALRMELSPETQAEIRKAIAQDPDTWWAASHFFWGMAIRNFLRHHCCLDEQLPTGNWDDYYVQAVEEAVQDETA